MAVVVVPCPFTETPGSKRRPALVLSSAPCHATGPTNLAMTTTKGHRPWSRDAEVEDLAAAGLPVPCGDRLEIFTLVTRLLLRQTGTLGMRDAEKVGHAIPATLPV